ncbi:MAG: UDP-4-amino-4,6-dideoxy-N-acetyl-beta-L-altrosamine transaminase [Agarilytica sp.]
MIPYGKQDISKQDIDAVTDVLCSDFITQGDQVPLFEKTLTNYCGAAHGVAVNSGTSALHIACLALGVGKGDWVWTSPISFVASANCALYCGAKVDFVDIDPRTYNLDPAALSQKLVEAKKQGRLPKVVIPVHLAGQSCDMQSIKRLSDEYGFAIIEDASHAIGGCYRDNKIGSCEFSDITVFSFHPVKLVTTAEGGAALTNQKTLAKKMAYFRSHGITRNEEEMTEESHGPWFYQQVALGFNYRMTDLQAALGTSQMQRLDAFVQKRHQLIQRYNDTLSSLPLTLPFQSEDSYSASHLYIIRLVLDDISISHRQVFTRLREEGIGVNLHYIPIYKQPYFQSLGVQYDACPHAEAYYQEAISLPMFSALEEEDFTSIVTVLARILNDSSG